jgi:hypothetical protein
MGLLKRLLIFISLIYFASCKESYTPEVTSVNANYLVVEGFINTGADSTIITLSRTVLVSNKTVAKPELGATVTVENEANISYPLKDIGSGIYAAIGLNLDQTKKHRIRIKTAKNINYLSDFVESKSSPAIDGLSFEAKTNGVQIYVNTHDDSNKSKYYRWDYQDTWEFHAEYASLLRTNGTALVERKLPDEGVYICYASGKSANIFLGSTIRLDKDVVNKAPLNFIAGGTERITVRYSTLVKQYVLTKEAYDFWEKLRKNTESLGSIFDAQPSQLTGNVHNIADAEEPVIGYIGAGTFTQKRFFIDRTQLPTWTRVYPYECLAPDTLKKPDDYIPAIKGQVIALENIMVDGKTYTTATTARCGDCTIRGTNKKPSFW